MHTCQRKPCLQCASCQRNGVGIGSSDIDKCKSHAVRWRMAENAVTLTFFARADKAEWSCVETVLFAGSKQKEAVAFCAVTRTSPHTAQMAPQMEISAAILRTGHGWDTSSWRRPVNQNKTCRTHRGVVLGHCISIAKMSSHLLCSVLMILATRPHVTKQESVG